MIFEKDNNKKNVLFIHGFGSNSNFWLPLKNTNRNYNMIAVSLELKNDSTIQSFANEVKEFIEDSNLKDLVVVGHSMGASVAFFLNKIFPVKKLILLSPHNAFLENESNTRKWVIPLNIDEAKESFENLVYDCSIWKDSIDNMAKRYLKHVENNRIGLTHLFESSIFNASTKAELYNLYEQISAPVSIITGRDDKFVSIQSVEEMDKYNFNIVSLPNTGHAILVDNLKYVSELITQEMEA